jgi:uncharacterized protein YqgC (DUF456 family)
MTLTIVLWIVAVVLIVVGFVGLVAPALPGPPLVYAGVVAMAAAHRFERIGSGVLLLLGFLTLAIVLVDLAASALGARRFGGSRWGALGAVVGLVVGLFFGLPGLVLGPLGGAIVAELLAGQTTHEATKAGAGAVLGLLAGAFGKVVLCLGMVLAAVAAHVF